MTRSSILNIAATLVAAVLSTPAMHAQSSSPLGVVKVPFAFDSGSTHLPAGTYTINLIGQGEMVVSNGSTSALALARWNHDTNSSGATKVVFHRYGNQYFLREVWDEGASRHMVSIETKAEASLRKASKSLTVADATAPSIVEVTIVATAR